MSKDWYLIMILIILFLFSLYFYCWHYFPLLCPPPPAPDKLLIFYDWLGFLSVSVLFYEY